MARFIIVDPSDPVARSYARIVRRLRNLAIIAIAIACMVVFYGVPSIQYTYRGYATRGFPTAMSKTEADYWNPIMGWRTLQAGEVVPGCPIIVFIPLETYRED